MAIYYIGVMQGLYRKQYWYVVLLGLGEWKYVFLGDNMSVCVCVCVRGLLLNKQHDSCVVIILRASVSGTSVQHFPDGLPGPRSREPME